MFLAGDLQNEIKTYFRAFPWKRQGGRRRGSEQPGCGSAAALLCERQDSASFSLGQLIFKLQQFPDDSGSTRTRRGVGRQKERGAEGTMQNWHPTNPVDNRNWLQHPHPSLPARAAVPFAAFSPRYSRQGRHQTGYFAPGAPYLKSSSKEEMSLFAFCYWSMEGCFSLHYTVCSALPQACL